VPREAFAAALAAEASRTEPERRAPQSVAPGPARVLALQQAVGNRAVSRLIVAGKLPPGAEDEGPEVPAGGWLGDLWNKIWHTDPAAPVTPAPVPTPPTPAASSASAAPATPAPAAPATTPPTPGASGSTPAATPAPTPPKLTKSVVSGPIDYDCGGWKWVIQWKLDKATTVGGWVVQRVDAVRNVTDKKGKKVPVGKGWNPAWTPYWEGWKINPGQSVTTYAETGDLEDDTYSGSAGGDNTKGTFTMTGKAEFYEGATLPKSMKPTNKAPAWILPFTKKDPKLQGGTGAIDHDLTATWDCTGSTKTTTITTR
jgi:hypothetical protein